VSKLAAIVISSFLCGALHAAEEDVGLLVGAWKSGTPAYETYDPLRISFTSVVWGTCPLSKFDLVQNYANSRFASRPSEIQLITIRLRSDAAVKCLSGTRYMQFAFSANAASEQSRSYAVVEFYESLQRREAGYVGSSSFYKAEAR
jgi:hypothetical protein